MRFAILFVMSIVAAPLVLNGTPALSQVSEEKRARAYYFEAEAALGDGRLKEAERYHDEAVELLGSSNAKLAALHVRILFAAQRYEEAKTAIEHFYTFDPAPGLEREIGSIVVRIDDIVAQQRRKRAAIAEAAMNAWNAIERETEPRVRNNLLRRYIDAFPNTPKARRAKQLFKRTNAFLSAEDGLAALSRLVEVRGRVIEDARLTRSFKGEITEDCKLTIRAQFDLDIQPSRRKPFIDWANGDFEIGPFLIERGSIITVEHKHYRFEGNFSARPVIMFSKPSANAWIKKRYSTVRWDEDGNKTEYQGDMLRFPISTPFTHFPRGMEVRDVEKAFRPIAEYCGADFRLLNIPETYTHIQ